MSLRETTIETLKNEATGDSYKIVRHKSGLDLLLYPMQDYMFTSAMFAADYGSINNCFKTAEDEDFVTVPDGIAHYLEHKLFENEDCGVFELYAKSGADGNAMTGFENTIYLFSCTENFYDSLRILLDFVQKPYFTQENVDKEQGIIGQEIRMTMDIPRRRVFFNLLTALYSKHPVRIDIAGTEESIAEITPELLYKCYYAFYDLHNMVLSVAGNFDVDKLIEVCDELLKPCEDKKLEILLPDEPAEVAQKRIEEKVGVGVPLFSIGFKCRPFAGKELVRKELAAQYMLSLLAGVTTPLYKKLKEEHLIPSGLSKETFDGKGFFALTFSGESDDPDRVAELILEAAEDAKKNGFDEEYFELLKKSEYGDLVKNLDSPENCAEMMLDCYFNGMDIFSNAEMIQSITIDEVYEALNEFIDSDKMSISIVR